MTRLAGGGDVPLCACASSAAIASPIPLPEVWAAGLAAPEPVEDARQLVGGDADTGVRDLEHRAWPILPGADRDSAAGQGEFERVAE